jgi:serine/threonine protein kinase
MPPGEPVLASAVPPPLLNGRYQIIRLIGKGAQARVYLAYDTRLKLWRALKVLAPAFLEDPDVRARFEQEAHAMARLAHPNLVRVTDVDHDGVAPYLVMELAHGGAVTDWIKRNGPVPANLACHVVAQMCDGLGHAHAAGVVHRDVKPHNVLVRADGVAVLTDFGIAQLAHDGASLTATGTVMGTFAFMAPEQRTDAKSVDLRADVYAVGATLFTMLTGKTSAELFFAEAKDAILREVPEMLRPVVLTACRYDRDERYPNMAEFKEALLRRRARLEPDRPAPPLTDRLLALPDEPPAWLAPDAGVDEILYPHAPPAPARRITPAPPALAAYPIPPGAMETPPRPLPLVVHQVSPVPRESRLTGRPAVHRSTASAHPDRRGYTDAGTPAPPRPIRIDIDGARSLSTELAPEAVHFWRGPSRAAVALVFALATVLSLASFGVADKFMASWQYADARDALVDAVRDDKPVIAHLEKVGAHTGALYAQLEQVDGAATAEEQARAAAVFAELVVNEPKVQALAGLPRAHVTNLSNAARRWAAARAHREEVRASWLARLTGDLGLD